MKLKGIQKEILDAMHNGALLQGAFIVQLLSVRPFIIDGQKHLSRKIRKATIDSMHKKGLIKLVKKTGMFHKYEIVNEND